jgi:hypothetical protein
LKIIALYLLSFVLVGSVCGAPIDDQSDEFLSSYQGKRYVSTMPLSVLNASPDFDPADPTLPKSIKNIIAVAFTQLEKVTGSKTGWKVNSISLQHPHQNERKWFYAVQFDSSPFQGVVFVTVTVDGRLGVIKEVQERTIE